MSEASLLERPSVRRVVLALEAHGIADRVVALAETARSAADAAAALQVPLGAIVKSLAFAAGDDLLLACIAGDRRLDTDALRAHLALETPLERAEAKRVKARTGFSIGGVAPVGHPEPLPVVLDESLARFEAVYAAAGHPHCVFATTFDELRRITGASVGNTFAAA